MAGIYKGEPLYQYSVTMKIPLLLVCFCSTPVWAISITRPPSSLQSAPPMIRPSVPFRGMACHTKSSLGRNLASHYLYPLLRVGGLRRSTATEDVAQAKITTQSVIDKSFIPTVCLQYRGLTTWNMWHYPAVVTNPRTTTAFLRFEPNSLIQMKLLRLSGIPFQTDGNKWRSSSPAGPGVKLLNYGVPCTRLVSLAALRSRDLSCRCGWKLPTSQISTRSSPRNMTNLRLHDPYDPRSMQSPSSTHLYDDERCYANYGVRGVGVGVFMPRPNSCHSPLWHRHEFARQHDRANWERSIDSLG
jgi:hypothetical protein